MPAETLTEPAGKAGGRQSETLDRIVVVGAGPVGMCAALSLARSGIPVTVFELGEGLAAESRASTFHPPTLELLDELGLADEVIARGLEAPKTQFRDRRKGPICEFDLGYLEGDTKFPFRIQLEQNKLAEIVLAVLLEEASVGEIDAEVRFGWRNLGVVSSSGDSAGSDGSVTLGFTCDPDSADPRTVMNPPVTHTVTAPWVIACDGAHSATRESLGLDLIGETYPERFLVASVSEELTDHMEDLAYVNYVADPDEWLVLLRTPDHWRVLLPIAPEDEREEGEFTEADVQERLTGVYDLGRPWEIIQWSPYIVNRRVAEHMRVGRVLLAGDAAHQNSPLGGMGMNSGIQDGISAARRLSQVWFGTGDESLLDEYDVNRRKVATDFVQTDSHANWLALREPDPARREELQAEMRATAADPEAHRAKVQRSAMIDAIRTSL